MTLTLDIMHLSVIVTALIIPTANVQAVSQLVLLLTEPPATLIASPSNPINIQSGHLFPLSLEPIAIEKHSSQLQPISSTLAS